MSQSQKLKLLCKKFAFYTGNAAVADASEITRLPFTTKETLQDFDIAHCPQKPVLIDTTSGTTGKSTLIGHSKSGVQATIRRLETIGYSWLKEKKGNVACVLFDSLVPYVTMMGHAELIVPRNNLDREELMLVAQRIAQSRASLLGASSHLVQPILLMLRERGYGLQNLIYGGVKATPDFVKFAIQNTRRAVEVYASCELPVLAARMAGEERFRVLDEDGFILEIMDGEGGVHREGQGILVATDLNNHSYPIIRYITDDLVVLEKSKTTTIRYIGRVGNYIKVDGDLVGKTELTDAAERVVGSSNYILEVHSDKNLKDRFVFFLTKSDMGKRAALKKELYSRGFFCPLNYRTLRRDVPKGRTGKCINIIDRRTRLD